MLRLRSKCNSMKLGKSWLLCAALLACSFSAPAQAVSAHQTRISALPNGVELADGPSLLDVQILENGLVCIHVRVDGKATPHTFVLADHPVLHSPQSVTRSESNGTYSISAAGIAVRIKESSPYSIAFLDAAGKQLLDSQDPFKEARAAGVTMLHEEGETLYGIHGIGLKETSGPLTRDEGGQVVAGVQGNSGAPWVFTDRYGLLVDSDGGEFTTAPGSITFRRDSRPDVEYFVVAGPPLETMASLSRLVGPPPLPPKWTLGFINSQWGATEAEVEKIVMTYREKQLPIDGFILDFDWKAWGEDNYGEWRWNSTSGAGNVAPDKFPDGASGDFARWMSVHGVELGGILKPRILTMVAGDSHRPTEAAAYATEHHFWYPNQDLIPDYFSHRPARDLDFNNSEERAWFWQHLASAFHAGMVAWWNDEADESGSTIFNNSQFLNMGRTLYDGQRAESNLRVWSINRNFYLGASRYAYAGWSGDIGTGFDSMAFQRRRMLAALNTGEFHWSMDTGGFFGHPSPENYARWMEFAAFVPIMRVHGELNEKRQPWVYGPVAESAARHALELRYELLPYIYSYERRNTEGEVGLVRPLAWEFPADPAAAAQETEWMFGDALLVAPVVTEGATTQTVYLPSGNWYDYASGKSYVGAKSVQLAVDAATWKDIPLFVRAGSIVATEPVEQYVGEHPVQEITLDIFPNEAAATFITYDDDGTTYNYEKGEYLRQQIVAQLKGKQTLVSIDGATGRYAGSLRTYLLRIHVAAKHLTVNGAAIPRVDEPGFQTATTGWTRTNDRFGPVVLARVGAGSTTPSTIALW